MEIEIFYPKNTQEWRDWLEQHHQSKTAVWVVFHNKASKKPTISWSESVTEALCFGWIDSKKVKIDSETSHQFFTKRKAKSTWSKINKDKVQRLIEDNLMAPAGYAIIEIAKQNGSWTSLDEVEELVLPGDLQKELQMYDGAEEFYHSLSKSKKKMILYWVVSAKRQETREIRIKKIAEAAAEKKVIVG